MPCATTMKELPTLQRHAPRHRLLRLASRVSWLRPPATTRSSKSKSSSPPRLRVSPKHCSSNLSLASLLLPKARLGPLLRSRRLRRRARSRRCRRRLLLDSATRSPAEKRFLFLLPPTRSSPSCSKRGRHSHLSKGVAVTPGSIREVAASSTTTIAQAQEPGATETAAVALRRLSRPRRPRKDRE